MSFRVGVACAYSCRVYAVIYDKLIKVFFCLVIINLKFLIIVDSNNIIIVGRKILTV